MTSATAASNSASARATCGRNSRLPSCRTRAPGNASTTSQHVTSYLKKHLPNVPILIAGNGNRLLTVAAQHADMIGLTGANDRGVGDPLAERIEFVRAAAGDRFADLELNLAITAVPSDNSGKPDLSMTRRYAPTLSDEQLLALPAVLSGSPRDIADTLRGYRETYGLTSVTVQEHHAETFAKVIAEFR